MLKNSNMKRLLLDFSMVKIVKFLCVDVVV